MNLKKAASTKQSIDKEKMEYLYKNSKWNGQMTEDITNESI